MLKQSVMDTVLSFFPKVKIGYKNQSTFMKIIGGLLFFNPLFMKSFITTIGSTIYYPSSAYVDAHPVSSLVVLLHELVHVHDEKKYTEVLFNLLYLMPQLLAILFIPLLFLVGWKFALLSLLFLAPIPAYFRMYFEKRAYIASLYVMNKLNALHPDYKIDLDDRSNFFVQQFKNGSYYFMWPFSNLDKEFAGALQLIKNGERPYQDDLFDILDKIIAVS